MKTKTFVSVSAVALVLALAACSNDDDARLARDLTPPQRMELMAPPPVAPDVNEMHPALQLAKTRGLKTNVYFNEELQQNIARLAGMEETLSRLQNDLQGTAMAMQRVEMMRQEIEAMNVRMQSLQERLMYAGPVMVPVPADTNGMTTVVTERIIEQPANGMRPTPLMGDMAAPPANPGEAVITGETTTAQISKPVVDEKKSTVTSDAKAPVSAGAGVNDVRIGVHSDSVRIVLDVDGNALGFSANLDAAEKLLTVELPSTPWKAAKTQTLKGNPLIASYTAESSGKGSVIVFALKADTKVTSQKTIKGSPSRLVIDLSR